MITSTSPDREMFRSLVQEIAEKAKATLPEANGRVDKAVALVLQGDVELLEDGTARVYSQSNGITSYRVVNGTCDCQDFTRAPSSWCKHRIAYGLAVRVQARMPQAPAGETTPAAPVSQPAPGLPEAPASCNVYVQINGHKVQVTLRDTDEHRMLARLQTLLAQYPPAQPQAPSQAARPPRREAGPVQEVGWCALHNVEMTRNTKDGRQWFSHHTADGWCKGKRK
jgi:hypothetical protein